MADDGPETMPTGADLLGEFEEHSPTGIRALMTAGVSPTEPIHGKRPIDALIEMYLRSPRFAECLQIMLDAGAILGDPLLQAILLDDDGGLRGLLSASRENLKRKLNPLCAFTSCRGVTALHICAEFRLHALCPRLAGRRRGCKRPRGSG